MKSMWTRGILARPPVLAKGTDVHCPLVRERARASWAGVSLWLSFPWIYDLSQLITTPAALLVVGGIAIVPGYLNAQLVTSLLVDRPPPLRDDVPFPALSLVIAAHNEVRTIGETLAYAQRQ